MAEATKSTRTVTTTEEAFTLTLSAAEFTWLKDMVGAQPPGDGASVRIWEAMKAPATVDPDTYDYMGTTYDLAAKYRDTDGDVWRFTGARDDAGLPLMSCNIGGDEYADWSLARVLDNYTTLRKS